VLAGYEEILLHFFSVQVLDKCFDRPLCHFSRELLG
jgi:hypothetical protein